MFIRDIDELSQESIIALDVGCSGTKPFEWERLGKRLKYYGVDPLVNEIDKLARENPNDTYLAASVIDVGCTGQADEKTSHFFSRTSAAADMENSYDIVRENFNSGQDVVFSSSKLKVSELLDTFGLGSVDLLKIDVDGDDFPLLKAFFSVEESFVGNLLAFEIESQFHGDEGSFGNTFGNIIQLANSRGFYLYRIQPYTYSRACLRKPYVHQFPAQTFGGQVLWADALFVRDGFQDKRIDKLKKLALILDIYELDDCAFELISTFPDCFRMTSSDIQQLRESISLNQSRIQIIKADILRLIKAKIGRTLRA